jgi:hypothetical protein
MHILEECAEEAGGRRRIISMMSCQATRISSISPKSGFFFGIERRGQDTNKKSPLRKALQLKNNYHSQLVVAEYPSVGLNMRV